MERKKKADGFCSESEIRGERCWGEARDGLEEEVEAELAHNNSSEINPQHESPTPLFTPLAESQPYHLTPIKPHQTTHTKAPIPQNLNPYTSHSPKTPSRPPSPPPHPPTPSTSHTHPAPSSHPASAPHRAAPDRAPDPRR